MRKYLYVTLIALMAVSGSMMAQEAKKEEVKTADNTAVAADSTTSGSTEKAAEEKKEESKSLVPDSTSMTLGMAAESKNVMPANFRGGDPDSNLVRCLEDVKYEKHEHSLIYNDNASELASGSAFASEPNITWTTSKKDDDGNFHAEEPVNTNVAKSEGSFFSPGEYQIGNSGARQVNEPAKEEKDAEKTASATANASADDGSKTVTAEQNMGVVVYDCTCPDICIAFQEGAGNVDMAASESELKQKIYTDIVANLGRPSTDNIDAYGDTSYLFIDEGKNDEREKEPWNKTARVSRAGALFDENGAIKFDDSTIVKSVCTDSNEQTYQIHVDDKAVKGIYVRQNVPFIFTAVGVDNGDERKVPIEVQAQIERKDESVVEKTDNAYIFRVANYPRDAYQDQPDYYFVARAADKDYSFDSNNKKVQGTTDRNVTTVRIPLYVVENKATFEKSGN